MENISLGIVWNLGVSRCFSGIGILLVVLMVVVWVWVSCILWVCVSVCSGCGMVVMMLRLG